MMQNKFRTVFEFIKKHIVVFAYFLFFVLALLPTGISSIQKFGIFYKAPVLLVFILFIGLYILKKKIKLNYRLLVIPATIFIVFSLYYMFVLPTYFNFTAPEYSYIKGVSITIISSFKVRLNSVMDIFNICFFATLFLLVTPKLGLNKIDLKIFVFLVSVLVVVTCLFSIHELKSNYKELDGLHSFLSNKNTFGEFLMVGVLCSFFAIKLYKNIFAKIAFALLTAAFLVFVVLSKSSTAAILSALFILIGVVLFVFSFDVKVIWKVLILVLLGAIIAFVLASPYIPFVPNNKISEILKDLYEKTFVNKSHEFNDLFTGRGKSWRFGIYIIRPKYLMLGYGSATFRDIVFRSTISYFTTAVLTNAYIEIFDVYGVIGSIFYLGVIVYLFTVYFKSKNELSEYFFVFLIIYLMYAVFESLILFESFSGSLLITPLLVAPASYFKEGKLFARRKEVINNG